MSEAEPDRAAQIVAGLDLGDWSGLAEDAAPDLADVYGDGATRALRILALDEGVTINQARAEFGLAPVPDGDRVPDFLDQVNPLSVAWAKDRAAALVSQVEGNTRDMLRATVARAIDEGWGAEKLSTEISTSAGFSPARASTIARTEVIAANNRGNLDGYKASGVATGKEWLTAGDDLVEEICEDNEAAGAIGLDEDFPSGDDAQMAAVRDRGQTTTSAAVTCMTRQAASANA